MRQLIRSTQWSFSAMTLVAVLAGCGNVPASFLPSTDPDIFGTLVDDRGSFEFNLNPDTGNLQRVDADDGTIFLPTDGQDFGVERPDNSSITTTPEGENDVLVAIRNDPLAGSTDLRVDREALGGLADVIPPNNARISRQMATCGDNQAFLDAACTAINAVDIPATAALISQNLMDRGGPSFPTSAIEAVLTRYLQVVVDCCQAWDEFRMDGGDACAEG